MSAGIERRLAKLERETAPRMCYAIEKNEGETSEEAYRLAGISPKPEDLVIVCTRFACEGLPPLDKRLLGVTEMRDMP